MGLLAGRTRRHKIAFAQYAGKKTKDELVRTLSFGSFRNKFADKENLMTAH
jgi:hypothetical protein